MWRFATAKARRGRPTRTDVDQLVEDTELLLVINENRNIIWLFPTHTLGSCID